MTMSPSRSPNTMRMSRVVASSSTMRAMISVDDTGSMPMALKMRRFFGLFTLAMQRGTSKLVMASSHATRFLSSWPISATNKSASSTPASS